MQKLQRQTGWRVPSLERAAATVRVVAPERLRFRDDGYIPNNPSLPVLMYTKAIRFDHRFDRASTIEVLLERHGWRDLWRNGIYSYVHYHSRIHEVLAVAFGSATLRIGGNKGRTLTVRSGDVIVLPSGTGHECLRATKKFLVVGGYPTTGTYDECRGSFSERQKNLRSIAQVPLPATDPLFGRDGPLRKIWSTCYQMLRATRKRK